MDGGAGKGGRAHESRRKKSGHALIEAREEQEAALDRFLERIVRSELGLEQEEEDDDDVPPPVILMNPLDYAIDAWWERKQHGTLAEAGELNDQPAHWQHDNGVISARYHWWYNELLPEAEAERGGKKRHKSLLAELTDSSAADWGNMLGD